MKKTKPKAKAEKSDSILFPLRKNDIRASICFAASVTAAAHTSYPNIPLHEITIILASVFYTACSYMYLRKGEPENNDDQYNLVSRLDAVVVGFILSFLQFTILPTFLFILTIQFHSAISGGVKNCIKDSIAFCFGVALTFVVWEPRWTFSSDAPIDIVSIVAVCAYFCIYGLFLNFHIQKLVRNTKKLVNEQIQYKLRTYKLSRYLTPSVWQAVNEGREESLKPERKRISVFFSDIQGFSALSEELESETITALLNSYLTEMGKIAAQYKGNIDKFMGDGMMILFGDSKSQGPKADCLRSVSMAIKMRKKMKELQTIWYNQGIKKPLQIRMGINTGYCNVGTFGTNHYTDYTALGTHVNLASRMESAADAGEILVSHETWSLVKDVIMCRDKGEITVKGFSHPVKVYQIVDFRKDLGKNQSYFEEITEGFSMHLDLDKIRNYDKHRIINALEDIAERVKDKIL